MVHVVKTKKSAKNKAAMGKAVFPPGRKPAMAWRYRHSSCSRRLLEASRIDYERTLQRKKLQEMLEINGSRRLEPWHKLPKDKHQLKPFSQVPLDPAVETLVANFNSPQFGVVRCPLCRSGVVPKRDIVKVDLEPYLDVLNETAHYNRSCPLCQCFVSPLTLARLLMPRRQSYAGKEVDLVGSGDHKQQTKKGSSLQTSMRWSRYPSPGMQLPKLMTEKVNLGGILTVQHLSSRKPAPNPCRSRVLQAPKPPELEKSNEEFTRPLIVRRIIPPRIFIEESGERLPTSARSPPNYQQLRPSASTLSRRGSAERVSWSVQLATQASLPQLLQECAGESAEISHSDALKILRKRSMDLRDEAAEEAVRDFGVGSVLDLGSGSSFCFAPGRRVRSTQGVRRCASAPSISTFKRTAMYSHSVGSPTRLSLSLSSPDVIGMCRKGGNLSELRRSKSDTGAVQLQRRADGSEKDGGTTAAPAPRESHTWNFSIPKAGVSGIRGLSSEKKSVRFLPETTCYLFVKDEPTQLDKTFEGVPKVSYASPSTLLGSAPPSPRAVAAWKRVARHALLQSLVLKITEESVAKLSPQLLPEIGEVVRVLYAQLRATVAPAENFEEGMANWRESVLEKISAFIKEGKRRKVLKPTSEGRKSSLKRRIFSGIRVESEILRKESLTVDTTASRGEKMDDRMAVQSASPGQGSQTKFKKTESAAQKINLSGMLTTRDILEREFHKSGLRTKLIALLSPGRHPRSSIEVTAASSSRSEDTETVETRIVEASSTEQAEAMGSESSRLSPRCTEDAYTADANSPRSCKNETSESDGMHRAERYDNEITVSSMSLLARSLSTRLTQPDTTFLKMFNIDLSRVSTGRIVEVQGQTSTELEQASRIELVERLSEELTDRSRSELVEIGSYSSEMTESSWANRLESYSLEMAEEISTEQTEGGWTGSIREDDSSWTSIQSKEREATVHVSSERELFDNIDERPKGHGEKRKSSIDGDFHPMSQWHSGSSFSIAEREGKVAVIAQPTPTQPQEATEMKAAEIVEPAEIDTKVVTTSRTVPRPKRISESQLRPGATDLTAIYGKPRQTGQSQRVSSVRVFQMEWPEEKAEQTKQANEDEISRKKMPHEPQEAAETKATEIIKPEATDTKDVTTTSRTVRRLDGISVSQIKPRAMDLTAIYEKQRRTEQRQRVSSVRMLRMERPEVKSEQTKQANEDEISRKEMPPEPQEAAEISRKEMPPEPQDAAETRRKEMPPEPQEAAETRAAEIAEPAVTETEDVTTTSRTVPSPDEISESQLKPSATDLTAIDKKQRRTKQRQRVSSVSVPEVEAEQTKQANEDEISKKEMPPEPQEAAETRAAEIAEHAGTDTEDVTTTSRTVPSPDKISEWSHLRPYVTYLTAGYLKRKRSSLRERISVRVRRMERRRLVIMNVMKNLQAEKEETSGEKTSQPETVSSSIPASPTEQEKNQESEARSEAEQKESEEIARSQTPTQPAKRLSVHDTDTTKTETHPAIALESTLRGDAHLRRVELDKKAGRPRFYFSLPNAQSESEEEDFAQGEKEEAMVRHVLATAKIAKMHEEEEEVISPSTTQAGSAAPQHQEMRCLGNEKLRQEKISLLSRTTMLPLLKLTSTVPKKRKFVYSMMRTPPLAQDRKTESKDPLKVVDESRVSPINRKFSESRPTLDYAHEISLPRSTSQTFQNENFVTPRSTKSSDYWLLNKFQELEKEDEDEQSIQEIPDSESSLQLEHVETRAESGMSLHEQWTPVRRGLLKCEPVRYTKPKLSMSHQSGIHLAAFVSDGGNVSRDYSLLASKAAKNEKKIFRQANKFKRMSVYSWPPHRYSKRLGPPIDLSKYRKTPQPEVPAAEGGIERLQPCAAYRKAESKVKKPVMKPIVYRRPRRPDTISLDQQTEMIRLMRLTPMKKMIVKTMKCSHLEKMEFPYYYCMKGENPPEHGNNETCVDVLYKDVAAPSARKEQKETASQMEDGGRVANAARGGEGRVANAAKMLDANDNRPQSEVALGTAVPSQRGTEGREDRGSTAQEDTMNNSAHLTDVDPSLSSRGDGLMSVSALLETSRPARVHAPMKHDSTKRNEGARPLDSLAFISRDVNRYNDKSESTVKSSEHLQPLNKTRACGESRDTDRYLHRPVALTKHHDHFSAGNFPSQSTAKAIDSDDIDPVDRDSSLFWLYSADIDLTWTGSKPSNRLDKKFGSSSSSLLHLASGDSPISRTSRENVCKEQVSSGSSLGQASSPRLPAATVGLPKPLEKTPPPCSMRGLWAKRTAQVAPEEPSIKGAVSPVSSKRAAFITDFPQLTTPPGNKESKNLGMLLPPLPRIDEKQTKLTKGTNTGELPLGESTRTRAGGIGAACVRMPTLVRDRRAAVQDRKFSPTTEKKVSGTGTMLAATPPVPNPNLWHGKVVGPKNSW